MKTKQKILKVKSDKKEKFAKGIFACSAGFSIFAVFAIVFYILYASFPAFREIGIFNFLFGKVWAPTKDFLEISDRFGIFHMIIGSISVTGGAVLIGGSLGFFTAIFNVYFCPKRFRGFFNQIINLLAGIPSIVYGFFGLVVVVPLLAKFSSSGSGKGLLACSIVLGIMILPTVASISKNALEAVPNSYFEGALALGNKKEQAIFKVILPSAKSGIISGLILGIGRAIGETMAVMMIAGNSPLFPTGLFSSIRTLTINIVLEMSYSTGLHRQSLIATGFILLMFILVLNLLLGFVKNDKKEKKDKKRKSHFAFLFNKSKKNQLIVETTDSVDDKSIDFSNINKESNCCLPNYNQQINVDILFKLANNDGLYRDSLTVENKNQDIDNAFKNNLNVHTHTEASSSVENKSQLIIKNNLNVHTHTEASSSVENKSQDIDNAFKNNLNAHTKTEASSSVENKSQDIDKNILNAHTHTEASSSKVNPNTDFALIDNLKNNANNENSLHSNCLNNTETTCESNNQNHNSGLAIQTHTNFYCGGAGSRMLKFLSIGVAGLVVSVLAFIILFILAKGLPHVSLNLLFGDSGNAGMTLKPAFVTTGMLILISLAIALPIGIFTSIYLVEYSKKNSKIVKAIRLFIDTLAGIPSIVFGLFGMIVFCETLKLGYSILAGGMTLSLIILPTIIRSTEESLLSVSDSVREGSLALGAGKARTVFKVVLPSALSGIMTAIILSIGRIVGESAALIYTSGAVAYMPNGIFDQGSSFAVMMWMFAGEGMYIDSAYATASVLLIFVAILNGLVYFCQKKLSKKMK